MIPIQPSYNIHTKTFALTSAKAIDYDTIVLEKNRILRIQQTPMQIIKQSCYHGWTTYKGRRKAVIHHTNFYQKTPVPISITNRIYLFPTHSPNHIDNYWLSYQGIISIHPMKHIPQTILQFKDGQTLKLNVSKHVIKTQMKRTFQVMYQLETSKKQLKT